MMTWSQLQFQDVRGVLSDELVYLNDFLMVVAVFILSLVGYMVCASLVGKSVDTGLLHGQSLESIWTALPALVLISIGYPSLELIYYMESFDEDCEVTLKVVGHQWYWAYEYGHSAWGESVQFDSYMLPDGEGFRLLDVDNRAVLPLGAKAHVVVTSADVLHSWAVPSLGMKVDACPGRLNQMLSASATVGVSYGQCSEICGANHSFMPIVVEVVKPQSFLAWFTDQ